MPFLVIANNIQPYDSRPMKAPDVYAMMMKHRCWEFPPAAPHLGKVKPGDRLVFYLGGSHAKYLAGEGVVDGEFEEINSDSPVTFDRSNVPYFGLRLPLREIQAYPTKDAGLDTLMKLSFARDTDITRPYIGLLLRVGMRVITAEDLKIIRQDAGFAPLGR